MWHPNPHLRDVCHTTSRKQTKIQNGWFLSKYMMPAGKETGKSGGGPHNMFNMGVTGNGHKGDSGE
jgi:hypothetical protein